MNYFKSGWSYLSSSFTQSEGDPNESSNNDLDVSENQEETTGEVAVEPLPDKAWLKPDDAEDSNDDLIEFTDAVDNSEEQYAGDADAPLQTSIANSQEPCLESSEMPEVWADIKTANMEEPETVVSSEKVDLGPVDIVVEEKGGPASPEEAEKLPDDETKQPANGYSSLEASDSDDSEELLIPPPSAPVGIPTNTESQLNEIINNLGGDLGILTLEEEDHLEQTLPGEKTLFVTAYDHTICASPPDNDTTDVNINLFERTGSDSANTSSSISNTCDIESAELKNETDSQFSEHNRPSTPLLASDVLDHGLNETTSEQPFATSLLDVTVEEVKADLIDKVTEQENIIDPRPTEKEQSPVRVELSQQEVNPEPVINSIQHTFPDNIGEVILDSPGDINSRIDIKNSDPIPQESTVSAENKCESVSLEESISATPELSSVAGKVENLPLDLSTTQKTMDDPADAVPIGRGAYTIDYDDLDSFNPFQSSRAICNSPDLPAKPFPGTEGTQSLPVKSDAPNEQPTAIIESNHMEDTDIAFANALTTPTKPANGSATPTKPANASTAPTKPANASTTPTKPISAILEELPAKVSNQNDDSVSNEVLIPESEKIMETGSFDAKIQNSALELPVNKGKMAHDDEDKPIPLPRGSYSIDFDQLDNMDPFKTSKGIQNSPTKPKSIDFTNISDVDVDPFKSSRTLSSSPPKSPVKNNVGLLKSMTNNEAPDILPEPERKKPTENDVLVPSGELITIDADLENVDPAPQKKVAKKPVLGANRKKVAKPKSLKKKPPPIKAPDPDHPRNEEEDIILSKGSYNINFDDLDEVDPFKMSKGISNSPTEKASGYSFAPNTPKIEEKQNPVEDSPGKGSSVDLPGLPILTKSEPLSIDEMPKNDQPKSSNDIIHKEPVDKRTETVEEKLTKPSPVKAPAESSNGEDEILVSKGSYNLDFDDLDALDPFKSSKGLANSPTKSKPGYSMDFDNSDHADPLLSSKIISNSPTASHDKSNAKVDVELPKQQDKVSTDVDKRTETVEEKLTKPSPVKAPAESSNGEDEILVSKGSYNLDFDDLDALDPFKSSKGLANSPTKSKPGYSMDFDNSDHADPLLSSKMISNSPTASHDTSNAKVDAEVPKQQDKVSTDIVEAMPEEDQPKPSKPDDGANKQPVKKSVPVEKKAKKPSPVKAPPPAESNIEADEIPISKGSYNLDFDNLDVIDPFKSAKGLLNSPTETKPSGYPIDFDSLNSVDPFKASKAMTNSPPASPNKPKADLKSSKPEDKATSDDTKQASLGSNASASKEPDATKLESEKKPQSVKKPKKKASGLARKKLLKPPAVRARPPQPVKDDTGDDELPPLPKGAYNLDFANLDTMDPFKSSKGLSDSLTKESAPPVAGYSVNTDMDSIDSFKPKKSTMNSPPGSPKSSHPGKLQSDATVSNAAGDLTMREITASVTSAGDVDSVFQAVDQPATRTSDTSAAQDVDPVAPSQKQSLDYKQLQQQEFDQINEEEQFYPASSVFQDSASLAYLDKLSGAKTLTASQLRKQSLYVKFDPLISGSPLRLIDQQISQKNVSAGGDAANVIIDLKAAGDFGVIQKTQAASLATANVSTGFDNHTSMDPYDQPYLSQQSYNSTPSTLKYTQADFESALRKAEQNWEKEKNEIKTKEETLRAESEQMSNVVKEYDRLFAEMSVNGSRNGMLTREQQLLKAEHEQTLEDMAGLERSHEDLCRRYNRLKTVVAQFKQNEDILKTSTNEMMEEARATEQRYVSLKVKADEEIKKANDELQFVKSNALQEVTRAQAQLKMLELKCDSLQSQIRDCNRENEELTKLCDDLIACSKQGE